jgi:hypothetical protein
VALVGPLWLVNSAYAYWVRPLRAHSYVQVLIHYHPS